MVGYCFEHSQKLHYVWSASCKNRRRETVLVLSCSVSLSCECVALTLCEALSGQLSSPNVVTLWTNKLNIQCIRSKHGHTCKSMWLMQADPMRQSWDKRTPMHFAAQHRHPAVIRQLLLHPSLRQIPSPAMQNPYGSAMQYPIGSAVQHLSGSAMQPPPSPAMAPPPGSAMATPPGSAMQHPPGSPVPCPSMQPALHQKAPDIDQDQAQDMAEAAWPKAQSQVDNAHHNAQTDLHSNQTLQQAEPQPGYASIQEAASSLQSLQSGIQYEPYVAANGNEGPDATSNSSVDSVEQLDHTGQDAEAMQALLAITNDCSVQSPPRSHNPAGGGLLSRPNIGLLLHT